VSKWYLVVNDLIGGWSVGNRDKPQSEYDFRVGDRIIADFMEERDATAVTALLNLHDYPERPHGPSAGIEGE
jgi:hypothetical protein